MVHLTGSKFFLPSVDVHRINWKLKVMSVVWMLHPGCFSRQLPAAAEDIDSKQGDIALGPGCLMLPALRRQSAGDPNLRRDFFYFFNFHVIHHSFFGSANGRIATTSASMVSCCDVCYTIQGL